MKEKVLRVGKRDREYKEDSGDYLNNAHEFSEGFMLIGDKKIMALELFTELKLNVGRKVEQKQTIFFTLIANLLNSPSKPIRISRNYNDYRQNDVISFLILEQMDKLEENGYIGMKKGHYSQKMGTGKQTRIWSTSKLLQSFPISPDGIIFRHPKLIELKKRVIKYEPYISEVDGKRRTRRVVKKIPIPFKETAKTHRIRKALERINSVNEGANVIYTKGNKVIRLHTCLKAVFTDKFTLGGRLYTGGYSHYQCMGSKEFSRYGQRADITINGNKTIEVDFRGLHPFLLYAGIGIQYKGDPYSAVDKRAELRGFLKSILLSMINSPKYYLAQGSANNWLYNESDNEERQAILKCGVNKASILMDKFLEVHHPIAHLLCSDADTGLRLMNKDAEIALEVLNHFTKQGIPILCIHDSFIVESKYKQELCRVMKTAYHRATNYRISVKF